MMGDAPGRQALSEHRDQIARPLAAATGAEDLWAAVDGARQHLSECPACREALQCLAQAVAAQDEIPCAECRARWPRLSEQEHKPGPAPSDLRVARQHMAHCPECADGYARLLKVSCLEEQGRLAEPEHYPRFDLSFLARSAWQPAPANSPEAARQLAEGIVLRVRVLHHGVLASLDGLAAWLTPLAGPAYAAVRGKRGGSSQLASLPDPEADVRITLAVENARRGRANLSVEVCELAAGRPLQQVQVTLRSSAGREVVEARDGKATLAELVPDQYVVEVRCAGAQRRGLWRLPVVIEAA